MKVNRIRFENSAIRDMYWLIQSDFLLQFHEEIPLFPNDFNCVLQNGLDEICKELDGQNQVLLKLEQARSKKLGYYCEALLLEYFRAHPEIELLENNWQINRNGITVGELDFILEIKNEVIGLETAFKCYAQFGGELSDWKGPRQKDSLVNKLEKVKEKQLPLFYSDEVKKKYGIIKPYLFLKGHLFSQFQFPHQKILKDAEFEFVEKFRFIDQIEEHEYYYLFPKIEWVSGLYFSSSFHKKIGKDLRKEIIESPLRSFIVGVRSKNKFANYLLTETTN